MLTCPLRTPPRIPYAGECLECGYGGKLCIGPPTEEGFYYDAYMGDQCVRDTLPGHVLLHTHTQSSPFAPPSQHSSLSEADYPSIKARAETVCKAKQTFERLVLTKAEALRLFADNPFKVALITAKIPEGGYTTAYRCGPLIDLCRGPHVPTTGAIKAFEVTKTSSSYWLGSVDNDTLQRVYGVSFPDAKLMKAHLLMVEEAKKRDHRLLGAKQELFFFHDLSPGACFFQPHGARIYNALQDHIRKEYRVRGFHEVVTPNVFNLDLWRISGHADHYLENMFTFPVEVRWGVECVCAAYSRRARLNPPPTLSLTGCGLWPQAHELPWPLPHVRPPCALLP